MQWLKPFRYRFTLYYLLTTIKRLVGAQILFYVVGECLVNCWVFVFCFCLIFSLWQNFVVLRLGPKLVICPKLDNILSCWMTSKSWALSQLIKNRGIIMVQHGWLAAMNAQPRHSFRSDESLKRCWIAYFPDPLPLFGKQRIEKYSLLILIAEFHVSKVLCLCSW